MESEAEFKMMWLKFSSPTVIRLFIFTFLISFNHVSILFIFFKNCFCFIFFSLHNIIIVRLLLHLTHTVQLTFFFRALFIFFNDWLHLFIFITKIYIKKFGNLLRKRKRSRGSHKRQQKGPTKFMRKNENTSQKIWQHTNDYIWIDSKILIKNIW